MPQSEHVRGGGRLVAVEADGGAPGRGTADLLVYGQLDTFNTEFVPQCFRASYEAQMPAVCWSHNWLDPIGRWVDFDDTTRSLRGVFQLSDFDAVPRARQAYVQMKDGTLTDFSVGFGAPKTRASTAYRASRALAIESARLDEGSPVIRGSVAGSKLISLRAPGLTLVQGVLDADDARELVERLSRGELTLPEALEELNSKAVAYDEVLDGDDTDTTPPAAPEGAAPAPAGDVPTPVAPLEPDVIDSPEVADALARVAELMEGGR